MPIYEYEPDAGECIICNGRFERMQKRTEDALTICPICERPCHRVVSKVNVAKDVLSDENIAEKGFAKYEKTDEGVYEKVAGGDDKPDFIRKPDE